MAWNILSDLIQRQDLAQAPRDCSCNCVCVCECLGDFSSTTSERSGRGLWGTHAGNNDLGGIAEPRTMLF